MDKIITVIGYKNFITEMSYAPDWYRITKSISGVRPIEYSWVWFSYSFQLNIAGYGFPIVYIENSIKV